MLCLLSLHRKSLHWPNKHSNSRPPHCTYFLKSKIAHHNQTPAPHHPTPTKFWNGSPYFTAQAYLAIYYTPFKTWCDHILNIWPHQVFKGVWDNRKYVKGTNNANFLELHCTALKKFPRFWFVSSNPGLWLFKWSNQTKRKPSQRTQVSLTDQ